MAESELSPRHHQFIEEYIVTGNATQSYRTVYGKDVPYGTAATQASKLLKIPHIQAEVRAAQLDLRKRCRVRAERVIRELAKIAFSDIGDVLDLSDPEMPRLKNRRDIPAEARHAIQEISRTRFGVKVKLADKIQALDKLARHLGVYQELPPLETILALLPTKLREEVRTAIAAGILADSTQLGNNLENSAAGESTSLGTGESDGHPHSRDAGQPVANGFFVAPGEEAIDALLPAGGDGEDIDALFN